MNTIFEAILVMSCVLLALIPPIFVWHKVYDDGLLGRIGLLGVSFCAGVVVMQEMLGVRYRVDPEIALLTMAFMVFLVWHLFRFHSRVLRPLRRRPSLSDVVAAKPRCNIVKTGR